MKAGKKIQKKLDERVTDYEKMSGRNKDGMKGYTRPGSRKKG